MTKLAIAIGCTALGWWIAVITMIAATYGSSGDMCITPTRCITFSKTK